MKRIACLAFCWIAVMCLQAAAQEPKHLLKEFAVYPLKPSAGVPEDFSDLKFLKDLLSNKRIILLGEQSHGDGATFEAKVRLVKFLHSELGFDMLSFESGFYDNYKAGRTLKPADSQSSPLLESVFPIWSETKEFLPLIAYAHSQSNTAKPLLISGFDCQESAFFEREFLADVKEALGGSIPISEEEATNLDIVISSGPELLIGSPGDSLTFFAAVAKIGRAIDNQLARHYTPQSAMLRQTLASWLALVRLQVDDINEKPVPVQNPRDWQMAQNLIFLAGMYPDKKIICWGASYHFAKSTASVTETPLTTQMLRSIDSALKNDDTSSLDLKGAVPMGELLAAHFGPALYSLAFSSYDGTFGMLGDAPVSLSSLQPPMQSIESELVRDGMSSAFVDFNNSHSKTFFYSSALGNIPIYAQWARMFDGHFFIKTSFPPSYPGTQSTAADSTLALKKQSASFRSGPDERWVIDADTKRGVDYASVYLMNTSRGILTNANGAFVFNIPYAAPTDRIIISSLGYETDTLLVKDFLLKNTLMLKPKAYQMEAVTIHARAMSAREIVKRAQRRIRNNYYQDHSQQEFFFRTRTLTEDTVKFNEEAAVLVDNPYGINAGRQVEQNLTGTILQFRNTTQNASAYRWGGVGSIWLMYSHNMLIKKSNALHRPAFYTYTNLGTTELEHRPVYKISFECKRPMSFTTGYGYPAPAAATGTMFIDKENFAVLRIEMMVRRKPAVRKGHPDLVTDPWMHYQVETYVAYGARYFLNSSQQFHYSKFNDRKTGTAVRSMRTMELLSTSITTAPAQPLESPLLKIKSGIPKQDENFWKEHNFSVELPGEQLYKLFEAK